MTHAVTTQLVDIGLATERVVVLEADDEIWISPELWEQMLYEDYKHATFDGVRLTFGTTGEGIGQVTYELIHQPDLDADQISPDYFAVLRRRS